MNRRKNIKKEEFNLWDYVKYISSNWMILLLSLIIGGLIGYILNFQIPPIYQSSSSFSVTIDYTQTGALSDIQEDQTMSNIGGVLLSDSVIQETINQLKAENSIFITADDFRGNAFVDREDFRWTIRYRGGEPEVVYHVVRQWSLIAEKFFDEALAHAQTAESYLRILEQLQDYYQSYPLDPGMTNYGEMLLDDILKEIIKICREIEKEKKSSLGIFYPVSINLVSGAVFPEKPFRNKVNLFVLAGAFAGLFSGALIFTSAFIKKGKLD